MAEELRVPAVAPPPVRPIKCFQLFFCGDGGASGVGSGVAAAWSFCLPGFGSDGREALFRADGGGAGVSSDVVYISGGRVKLLVLRGDSDEMVFGVRSVRLVCSIRFAFGWELLSSWSSSSVEMAVDWGAALLSSSSTVAALFPLFPCHRRSGSADGRSTSLIRRRGGSAAFAPAAYSKLWSCASVVACGAWFSGPSASHHVGLSWRCDGRRRVPEMEKIGDLLCVFFVFSFKSRGFLVKWVCPVRVRAI